jgi:hypothetical protein
MVAWCCPVARVAARWGSIGRIDPKPPRTTNPNPPTLFSLFVLWQERDPACSRRHAWFLPAGSHLRHFP